MSTHQAELLQGLSPEEAQGVVALGTLIKVPSGGELFSLGAPADCVFVVERGRIALTLPMQVRQFEEDVLIEERSPGQALGWSALIPPHRFTLKATAPLDSEVLSIPRAALLAHFAAHPDVGYAVTRNVAEIMGRRLQVFQAMWLREMQRVVELRTRDMREAV
jgi:CRP/FNR family transcriptional regulator, cyclic AMP receptor protein